MLDVAVVGDDDNCATVDQASSSFYYCNLHLLLCVSAVADCEVFVASQICDETSNGSIQVGVHYE